MYAKIIKGSSILSKFCPNCNSKMPDEANFCLSCMHAYDNNISLTVKTISNKHKAFSLNLKENPFLKKFTLLSKKKKAACVAAFVFLIAFIPFSIYMLSPVEPVTNNGNLIYGQTNDGSNNKAVTRAEAIFNEILNNDKKKEGDNTTPNSEEIVKSNEKNEAFTNSDASINTTSSEIPNNNSNSSGGESSQGGNSENSSGNDNNISDPVLNYDDWEYKTEDGKTIITKYTGKDQNVIVPDQLNGSNVYKIEADTFSNNSTIQTVTFKDSTQYHTLWVSQKVFNNCSELRKINFPKNTDLGFFYEFAINCPKLNDIYIDHWQGKFLDGAFYWRSDGKTWELIMYCEGYQADTLNVPDWVSSVMLSSDNLSNNKYLKTINLPAGCTPPKQQSASVEYKYLEEINIADGSSNKNYCSYNGVVYLISNSSNYKLSLYIYPGSKSDKSYTFPENCRINFPVIKTEFNLETIYIPKTSYLDDSTLEYIGYRLENLKTVKVQKGHKDFTKYQSFLASKYNVSEY